MHRFGSVPRRRHVQSGDRQCSNPAAPNGTACSGGDKCKQTVHLPGGRVHRLEPGDVHRFRSVPRRRHLRLQAPALLQSGRAAGHDLQRQQPVRPDPRLRRRRPLRRERRRRAPLPISATSPARAIRRRAVLEPGRAQRHDLQRRRTSATQTYTCQAGACTGIEPGDVHRFRSVPRRRHLRSRDGTMLRIRPRRNGTTCSDSNLCDLNRRLRRRRRIAPGERRRRAPPRTSATSPGRAIRRPGQCSNPAAPHGTTCSDSNLCDAEPGLRRRGCTAPGRRRRAPPPISAMSPAPAIRRRANARTRPRPTARPAPAPTSATRPTPARREPAPDRIR